MSLCRAGERAEARVQRAARSARLREPTAAVETIPAEHSSHEAETLEVVIPGNACPPTILSALHGERLRVRSAQPQGDSFVVVATA